MAAFPTRLYSVDREAIEDLIHRRMGTSNVAKLKFMGSKTCYTNRGFKNVFKKEHYGRCITCDSARMKQIISHKEIVRGTILGRRWFFDVSGPFVPSINGGNVYLVILVEDVSGFVVVYFMKQKNDNEVLRVSHLFHNEYVTRFKARGVDNIQIQSDNGEFASTKVRNFWTEKDVFVIVDSTVCIHSLR